MKTKKSELLVEKEKHNSAFDALWKIKVLEKPNQLYLNGYHEMQEEHDVYLKAIDFLKASGYTTPDQVEKLEQIKSNIEDRISANNSETRDLRKEMRFCNIALELNNHIEKKIQVLDEANKSESHKSMTAKEMARNLLER